MDGRVMSFYEDFWEAGRQLPDRERKDLYAAILDYYFEGSEPEGLKGGAAAVFVAVRARVDLSRTRKETGGRGGRPKKQKTKTEPNRNQNSDLVSDSDAQEREPKRNQNQDLPGGVREGVGEEDKEEKPKGGFSSRRRAVFAETKSAEPDPLGERPCALPYAPPGEEEVDAWLKAQGVPHAAGTAGSFVAWHSANGWPRLDWRPLAAKWAREDAARAPARARPASPGDAERSMEAVTL